MLPTPIPEIGRADGSPTSPSPSIGPQTFNKVDVEDAVGRRQYDPKPTGARAGPAVDFSWPVHLGRRAINSDG